MKSFLCFAGGILAGFWVLPCAAAPWPVPKEQVEVVCEGEYGGHLQGVASNRTDAIFWTFTTTLVKTDLQGRLRAKAGTLLHLGDPAWHDGKVYVPACSAWDRPTDDSKVYVYDAADLKIIARIPLPDIQYGAGGIAYYAGHFFIVGGAPPESRENFVYEYDGEFHPVKTHIIPSGKTSLGVQNIGHFDGGFWLGCYGNILIKLDDSCKMTGQYKADTGYGLEAWEGTDVLVGGTESRDEGKSKRWRGRVRLGHTDPGGGVVLYAPK